MYADRVTSGSKRSVKERLNGNTEDDFLPRSKNNAKRQRQSDDKWKHDLYEDNEESKVGSRDLRLKLQRKGLRQASKSEKSSVTGHRQDLRERLSGSMHTQPANTDQPKEKEIVGVVANPARGSVPAEVPTSETKKVTNSASSRKKSQQKDETVNSLLQSLDLEKYLITFQAEEVDMTALMHMTDGDLKALGIPMGPRKKILLALDSRA